MCTSIPRCQRHVIARDILLCPNTFKITQPDHSLVFLVYNSSVTLVPLVMVLKASDKSHQDALSFSLEGNRAQCIKNGIDQRSSQHQKGHAIIQMSLALKGSLPGKNKHKASQPLQTSTYFKTTILILPALGLCSLQQSPPYPTHTTIIFKKKGAA